jgi:hypothetical protein
MRKKILFLILAWPLPPSPAPGWGCSDLNCP